MPTTYIFPALKVLFAEYTEISFVRLDLNFRIKHQKHILTFRIKSIQTGLCLQIKMADKPFQAFFFFSLKEVKHAQFLWMLEVQGRAGGKVCKHLPYLYQSRSGGKKERGSALCVNLTHCLKPDPFSFWDDKKSMSQKLHLVWILFFFFLIPTWAQPGLMGLIHHPSSSNPKT